jgi:hypothetical protein
VTKVTANAGETTCLNIDIGWQIKNHQQPNVSRIHWVIDDELKKDENHEMSG